MYNRISFRKMVRFKAKPFDVSLLKPQTSNFPVELNIQMEKLAIFSFFNSKISIPLLNY